MKCIQDEVMIGVMPSPPLPPPNAVASNESSSKRPPAGYTPRNVLKKPSGGIPLSFP